jgi:hypothetical protein
MMNLRDIDVELARLRMKTGILLRKKQEDASRGNKQKLYDYFIEYYSKFNEDLFKIGYF